MGERLAGGDEYNWGMRLQMRDLGGRTGGVWAGQSQPTRTDVILADLGGVTMQQSATRFGHPRCKLQTRGKWSAKLQGVGEGQSSQQQCRLQEG